MTEPIDVPATTSGEPVPDAKRDVRRPTPRVRRSPAVELTLAPELGGALGFRLRRAVGVADAVFAEVFAPLDITTQHYAILISIRHNPGCPPSALSALLSITPNNLVPHVDGLVARGYVRRTSSKADRRIRHLRLTKAGEAFVDVLVGRHDDVRARVEARMGEDNVAKLLELLALYTD